MVLYLAKTLPVFVQYAGRYHRRLDMKRSKVFFGQAGILEGQGGRASIGDEHGQRRNIFHQILFDLHDVHRR